MGVWKIIKTRENFDLEIVDRLKTTTRRYVALGPGLAPE